MLLEAIEGVILSVFPEIRLCSGVGRSHGWFRSGSYRRCQILDHLFFTSSRFDASKAVRWIVQRPAWKESLGCSHCLPFDGKVSRSSVIKERESG